MSAFQRAKDMQKATFNIFNPDEGFKPSPVKKRTQGKMDYHKAYVKNLKVTQEKIKEDKKRQAEEEKAIPEPFKMKRWESVPSKLAPKIA